MSPELMWIRSQLPPTRWLLFHCPPPLHLIFILLPYFFPPSISYRLGAMVYPVFNSKVYFLLQNYCCWPKARIWEINYVWSPAPFLPLFLVDMLFLKILTKADLCQISCRCCRKSLLAHMIILYNLPAAVFNGSCFSRCPTFLSLPPRSYSLLTTLYPRMWIFLPFEKNKSSVIKIRCLACWVK